MRKIKLKINPQKEIIKHQEYFKLLWCLAFGTRLITEIFDISFEEIFDYFKDKKKGIKYRSEVVRDEWYPKVYSKITKFLKLANDIKFNKITNKLISDDKFDKFLSERVAKRVKAINSGFMWMNDKTLIKIGMFYSIHGLMGEAVYNKEIKMHLTTKEIKEIKTYLTQSKKVYDAIIYDMFSYTAYSIKKKNECEVL